MATTHARLPGNRWFDPSARSRVKWPTNRSRDRNRPRMSQKPRLLNTTQNRSLRTQKGRMREWVDICVRKCRWHAPRKHVISGNHCRKLTSGCHIKVSKRGGLSILSSHDYIVTSEKQSEIGTAIFVCVCIHRTCPRDENDRARQQLLIRR